MGKEPDIPVSEEERRDLSIGLLREWWIAGVQALVDTAGSETALRYLKPHFVHSGKAGTQLFCSVTGLDRFKPIRVMDVKRVQGMMLAAIVDGSWGPTYDADDGSGIGVLKGCATEGSSKEVCATCEYMSCEMDVLDPSYEVKITRSLGNGEDECHWSISKKGMPPQVRPLEEFLTPPHLKIRPELIPGKETMEALCHAYLGEFWVMTTKAFIDQSGTEKALEHLRPYMYHSGISLGMRMKERLDTFTADIDDLVRFVELIQGLHQRKGKSHQTDGGVEFEISECPFSGSPPETCLQYEAFFNGICEAINPCYEFKYDRMMTKGEKSCHWTISKKGSVDKRHGIKEETPIDDPVRTLTMRFARGEITEEELEKKLAHLRKLGLIG